MNTPKKPIVPAIGYPIEGKYNVPPPGKKPPSRRADGHGMTQSIDPRTPEGKRWVEKQQKATKDHPPD